MLRVAAIATARVYAGDAADSVDHAHSDGLSSRWRPLQVSSRTDTPGAHQRRCSGSDPRSRRGYLSLLGVLLLISVLGQVVCCVIKVLALGAVRHVVAKELVVNRNVTLLSTACCAIAKR
eukprot:2994449-Pyramimonas_sp.AAC.1